MGTVKARLSKQGNVWRLEGFSWKYWILLATYRFGENIPMEKPQGFLSVVRAIQIYTSDLKYHWC